MDKMIKIIKENGFNVYNNNLIAFKGLNQLNKIVHIIYENDTDYKYKFLLDIKTDIYFQGYLTLYKFKNDYY